MADHWSTLGSVGVIALAAAFFLVDFAIDKLSAVRRGLRGGVLISAALGAILFDAHAGAHVSWVAAVLLGGGTAALLHGARAVARPAVSGDRAARLDGPVPGLSGATMSLVEDAAAALLVIVAFSAPAIAGAVVIAMVAAALLAAWHVRRLGPRPRNRSRTPE